ncbi:PQQ-binding-like beta-propeller repeat protein [Streptomyces sp. NPDC012888]|uniref:PQQ-binding-like beta-propeller repeat protein n=1 Tax=Streptomyces sp. NPDC012888 TaxID=3364855 RepID=UPI00369561A2
MADPGAGAVAVVDVTAGSVAHVDVGSAPVGVGLGAGGNVYVSTSDGTVKRIDAASHGVSATVPVGARPEGLAFEPHSDRVYVANSGDGTVSAIDLAAA